MREKLQSFACFVVSSKVPPVIARHAHRFVLGSFVLSGSLLASFAIYWIVFRLVLRRKVAANHHRTLRCFRKPVFWLFLIAATMLATPAFGISPHFYEVAEHVLHILFSYAWHGCCLSAYMQWRISCCGAAISLRRTTCRRGACERR